MHMYCIVLVWPRWDNPELYQIESQRDVTLFLTCSAEPCSSNLDVIFDERLPGVRGCSIASTGFDGGDFGTTRLLDNSQSITH